MRIRGAIFCQVKISRAWVQSAYAMIWGNQKWSGATPAFIANAIVIRTGDSKFKLTRYERLEETEMKIIIIDAIA